ncbi:MAG: valine--tRNA ligase [Candidatus Babeliales bacterium]
MEKQYEHLKKEQEVQELWQHNNTFAFDKKAVADQKLFSIDTPPPTVSGSLHIGHIFSYTHADIIARFERMSGKAVFYPMGFDDNGLATERFVEKKHQVSPYALGRSAFIKLCEEETALARLSFKSLWQRLGLSVDWQLTYSTIEARVRALAQESFIRLHQEGLIYRKNEPALFCTTCRTSVAQAELDDIEQASTFNTIAFKDANGNDLLIATTRPELLPACVAIFYHPSDTRYTHLKGTTATVPVFGLQVPLLPDELVDPAKGTGLVMCCAFGDKTDVHWIKTHKLPYTLALDIDGRFKNHTGILAGHKVAEARKIILERLALDGALKEQKPIVHAVNVHERCKKEIEYLTIAQWFLSILPYKKEFIAAADAIDWHPAFMKSRYVHWVENLSWDWCLSRQRFYGIPFPAWHCTSCNQILIAQAKQLPVDPQETPYAGTCPHCNSTAITPDTDVMDTWNTSALTPYICAQLYNQTNASVLDANVTKDFMPMSMRPQAHDIIRTWAFYTIAKSWMHSKSIPWKSIVISGHVLAENKEKFSKSKEQKKLDPTLLLNTYSADVIRYWTASGQLGNDVQFSEMQLKIGQRLVTKLWNAFRFIGEHIQDITTPAPSQPQSLVNAWIIARTQECFDAYKKALDSREFSSALDAVEKFFWHDVCDNYLEIIKHQLFNPALYATELVQETKETLYTVGLQLLQMYAPYMPHVTETLYQSLYKTHMQITSLHTTTYAQLPHTKPHAIEDMGVILQVIAMVRKLKTERQLSLKTELEELTVQVFHAHAQDIVETQKSLIAGVTQAKNIRAVIAQGSAHAELTQVQEQWHAQVIAE